MRGARAVLVSGAEAGAVGTLALNTATHLDMLARGRPPSRIPEESAGRVLDRLERGERTPRGAEQAERRQHRERALGELMGYGNGLALGVGYALLRSLRAGRQPSVLLSGVLLAAAAMVASNAPAARLGLTDPRRWSLSDWLADLIPHLAYGVSTALAYRHLAGPSRRGRPARPGGRTPS